MQAVRMVSVDTPEKHHYAVLPEVAQPKLDTCRQRLLDGFYPQIPDKLRDHLVDRLNGAAAARHIAAGEEASLQLERLLKERLAIPDGSQCQVATIPTGEVIDRYGRMLAYIAPSFAGTRSDPLPAKNDPARPTFNLDMVATGLGGVISLLRRPRRSHHGVSPREAAGSHAVVSSARASDRVRGRLNLRAWAHGKRVGMRRVGGAESTVVGVP